MRLEDLCPKDRAAMERAQGHSLQVGEDELAPVGENLFAKAFIERGYFQIEDQAAGWWCGPERGGYSAPAVGMRTRMQPRSMEELRLNLRKGDQMKDTKTLYAKLYQTMKTLPMEMVVVRLTNGGEFTAADMLELLTTGAGTGRLIVYPDAPGTTYVGEPDENI
jgi:hypothetical protein